MRKTSNNQTETRSTEYLTNTSQNCRDHIKQNLKKCEQPRGTKGYVTTKGNVVS